MPDGHFAVVVGINRYPGLRSLNHARGDAVAFADWLKHPAGGGLRADQVEVILDPEAPNANASVDTALPTKSQVDQVLKNHRRKIRELVEAGTVSWDQTRLYLYFSGHGLAVKTRDAIVLMANADAEDLGQNLSCESYREFLERAQNFHELVLFADCCREINDDAPAGSPTGTVQKGNNGQVFVAIGYATSFGDLAFEEDDEALPPDEKRGYFTRALLEGLRGQDEAALPGSGEINSNSLAAYVDRRVRQLTSHLRYPQKPWINAAPAQPIRFREANQVNLFKVTIRFPGFTGRVRLLDGALQPLGREHDAGTGPWVLRLPSGLYQLDAPGHPFPHDGVITVRGGDVDATF